MQASRTGFCFPSGCMQNSFDMLNKVYLAVLAIAVAVMAFFTFYAWSWLQSIGLPQAAVAGFVYHSTCAATSLWIFVLLLLILANAVLWTTGRAWAMWVTFLFFALFALISNFWMNRMFIDYQQQHFGMDDGLSSGPFLGAIMIIIMGLFVFADQFLLVRVQQKMYPPSIPELTENDEPEIIDKSEE